MFAISEAIEINTAKKLLTPNEYAISLRAAQIDKHELARLEFYRPECDEPAYVSLDEESIGRR